MRTAPALLPALICALALGMPASARAARELLSKVPADLPAAALSAGVHGDVGVRVHVTAFGLVDSAVAVSGPRSLRPSAEASARWWIFRPSPGDEWVVVTVTIDAPGDDVEPLRPDVLAMARDAEAHGDLPNAFASLTGALGRIGQHPSLRNPWAIRERLLALAHRVGCPPVSTMIRIHARNVHAKQQRTMASLDHADLVRDFDEALDGAPYWNEPYLWCAGSQLGCGRMSDALRSLRAYRLGSQSDAERQFADRALARIAAGDTLGVCESVKNQDQDYGPGDE